MIKRGYLCLILVIIFLSACSESEDIQQIEPETIPEEIVEEATAPETIVTEEPDSSIIEPEEEIEEVEPVEDNFSPKLLIIIIRLYESANRAGANKIAIIEIKIT